MSSKYYTCVVAEQAKRQRAAAEAGKDRGGGGKEEKRPGVQRSLTGQGNADLFLCVQGAYDST